MARLLSSVVVVVVMALMVVPREGAGHDTLPSPTSLLATSSPSPSSSPVLLLVPDTARIDNALLKASGADKFLSLWFIYVLSENVQTSGDSWTLFIPKNGGLPRGGGFLQDREATRRILLNHAVLGEVLDPRNPPPKAPSTLSGTPLLFTQEDGEVLINGVRWTGEEHKLRDGVVYVLEGSLPLLDLDGEAAPPTSPSTDGTLSTSEVTSLPTPTHRFATLKPRRNRPLGVNSVKETKTESPVFSLNSENEASVFRGELAESDPSPTSGGDTFGFFSTPSPSPAPSTPESPEFEISGPRLTKNQPFIESFIESLDLTRAANGAEFLHHFQEVELKKKFRETGRYTALVPYDSAFYSYYPIDWGFNPFLVANFTRDVLLNHFVRGDVVLENLPSLAELHTLGGQVIKFTRRGDKLLANGVDVVLESENQLSKGRSYFITQLLFVDYDRVADLQREHGDLETAPLLGDPWPTSQFLSHLLERLQDHPKTSFYAEYLNLTNLAYLLPGHDENLDPQKYTAFIPVDSALSAIMYADAPDPFLLDDALRENLILNHLVRGRLYEDDLQDGIIFLTLSNNTITITKGADGTLRVNGSPIIESQIFLYNLGNLYLVDGVLGITDQDIVKTINKFPEVHLQEPTKDLISSTSSPAKLPPLPPSDLPSTTPEPFTTTTTMRPTVSFRPLPATIGLDTTTLKPRLPTISSSTSTRPPFRFTTRSTTSAPEKPLRITTPRIRFETRTEISISRQINDGAVEPIELA